MKKTVMSVLAFCCAIAASLAQDLPAALPIASIGQLRAYAFEQVQGGEMDVYGNSIMWSSTAKTFNYIHAFKSTSVDEVVQNLQSYPFSFRVADKTQPLYVWASLHNKDWGALFYGSSTASVSESVSNNLLSKGVSLRLADYVPIYVGTSVQSAYIKGNVWQDVSVYNGYIYFPAKYSEESESENILVLRSTDDKGNSFESGYSIATGMFMPTTDVSGVVDLWVNDYQSYYDNGYLPSQILYVGVWGYLGNKHESPVASIVVTETRSVKFLCIIRDSQTNTIVDLPKGGWLFKKGAEDEIQTVLTPGQWSSAIILDPGEYFFYPETDVYDVDSTVTTTTVEKG